MKLLSGVGLSVTGVPHSDIHDHHTMVENIHVVQSIIPLLGLGGIQGQQLYYVLLFHYDYRTTQEKRERWVVYSNLIYVI